jgi:glycosyltransferase involved in cell wall biosynthesis
LGVAVDRVARFIGANDRAALRRRLGLPAERAIVLSVGAVNRQKRMDYVIEEIAALPEPRPFLLIAGQLERESPDIAALARERLGPHGHDIRTVAPAEMPDLYRAADVFVLASLWESFGRVLVEAQAHGLPCLAHDYPVMRWVLGEHGRLGDLTRPGVLARMVIEIDESDTTPTAHAARHQAAYERFSWDVLAPRYVDMLQRVAGREVSAAASQTTR